MMPRFSYLISKLKNSRSEDDLKSQLTLVRRAKEVLALLWIMGLLFTLMSLSSYYLTDPGVGNTGFTSEIKNRGGMIGAWIASGLYFYLGWSAWLLILSQFFSVIKFVVYKESIRFISIKKFTIDFSYFVIHLLNLVLIILASSVLIAQFFDSSYSQLPVGSGGLIGEFLLTNLVPIFGKVGNLLITITVLLIASTLYIGVSWFKLSYKLLTCMYILIKYVAMLPRLVALYSHKLMLTIKNKKNSVFKAASLKKSEPSVAYKQTLLTPNLDVMIDDHEAVPHIIHDQNVLNIIATEQRQEPILNNVSMLYQKPEKALLHKPKGNIVTDKHTKEDTIIAEKLTKILSEYGISATIVNIQTGPVITCFEIQPAAGIKASRITSLASDIARSLTVASVRVVEVIPGKSVVGIEVPKSKREIINLHEVFASESFTNNTSVLTLGLGKDSHGKIMVADLAKMPHLLVAGTTGSGKSVGINSMLLSILFKASPDDVRMIMIDPKMLELSLYNGIPHLLYPVITDMKEAGGALNWCVQEMDERYEMMTKLGVRNIAGYNQKVAQLQKQYIGKNKTHAQPTDRDRNESILEKGKLPYIVIIIDEFADMMMLVGKQVEQLIARIAQKARAAGIHLILATQRPSVDVITGLIKANIPTRISFQVSSKIDSRTILDQGGAEQLLGHGDMLYLKPGHSAPVRLHGALVEDQEVCQVVDFWKQQGSPTYIENLTQAISNDNTLNQEAQNENDPLYDEVIEFIKHAKKASISLVQRRFKIGYNRAARIIESLEAARIVSEPKDGSGVRAVLISKSDHE